MHQFAQKNFKDDTDIVKKRIHYRQTNRHTTWQHKCLL